MNPSNATDIAMQLIEHIEKLAESGLRPPHPTTTTFAAPYRVPATLAALWEWCAGESADHPGLFTLAHPLIPGFPHGDDANSVHGLWRMWLEDPETIAWNLTNGGALDRWGEDWLQIAVNGLGGCLAVDAEGSIFVWSSDVDVEPVLVHRSFDRWMHELSDALAARRVAITKDDEGTDVVRSGQWELSRSGADDWAPRSSQKPS